MSQEMQQQLITTATNFGLNLAGAIAVLFFAWIIAGWLAGMASRALAKAKIDETLSRFLAPMVRWLILLLALLACLSIFGIQTTSFAAVIGAAGLAVGLAFQGTLANFAAGVMLLIFRPFKVGDVVQISGETGVVFEIQIFTTSIDTFDNRRIIIPNGGIFGSTIENITFHSKRRADVDVGVDYSADIDQTRELLTQAAASVEGQAPDTEPAVVLLGLGASSVDWSVRVWAPTADFGTVKQAAIRAVKKTLDDAGIGIPFPQMDVHMDSPSAG
ncbi:MAG: mechanosensitive ion channel [Pirellulales bacterium]|nr:mechanosensitive ion channel [Pirellulales bacterium]